MKRLLKIFLLSLTLFLGKQASSQNAFANGTFTFGTNPGFYGSQFQDQDIYDLAFAGGSRSTRSYVPVQYWLQFGMPTFAARFQHAYQVDSMRNNTFFLDINGESFSPYTGQSTKVTAGGKRSNLPAGLNLAIFNGDSTVNVNNVWAKYCDSVVRNFGAYFSIYEVVNEPDFSFTGDAYQDSTVSATSWQKREPTPDELSNLNDSLENYVLMAKIANLVIKHVQPSAKIATGGIGYSWFYMWCIRKGITPWIDLISFHEYPYYQWTFCNWNGTACGAGGAFRNSDMAVHLVDSVATMIHFIETQEHEPLKQLMTTESMVPRWSYPLSTDTAAFPNNKLYGNGNLQVNFWTKMITKMSLKNKFYMTYMYETGEGETFDVTTSNSVFNAMGIDTNLVKSTVGHTGLTPMGHAAIGMLALLRGYNFASVQPTFPAGTDGALWTNGTKNIYTIWASVIANDKSEVASATFTLPAGTYNKFNNLGVAQGTVSGGATTLTGDYTYFVTAAGTVPLNPNAVATATTPIRLPLDSTLLVGTGSNDPNSGGSITGYLWSQVSGPVTATLRTPTASTTQAIMTAAGTYVFSLKVTSAENLTATTQVTVVVNPALANPTANAGVNQTITLPTSAAILTGSGTDPNAGGSITAYHWTFVSGPKGVTFANANVASTTVSTLTTAGVYTLQLQVTDNFGLIGTKTMTITVNAAVLAITVTQTNQSITLPTSTVSLTPTVTDPNTGVTTTTYVWTKVSGPAVGTITTPAAKNTTITGLTTAGTYVYKLTVTDNKGGTGNANVTITVSAAAKLPPVSRPFPLQTSVAFPSPASLAVNGNASSDPNVGGSITTYHWTYVSGPTGSTIVNPNVSATTITGLKVGTYLFDLRVTDNFNLTNDGFITVHVYKHQFAISKTQKHVKTRINR